MKTCRKCKGVMIQKHNSTLFSCPKCHRLNKGVKNNNNKENVIKKTDVQKVFNTYIKKRDVDLNGLRCLDCGNGVILTNRDVSNRAEASHYISRAVAPHLSFYPNNVFMCCQKCNSKHNDNTEHFAESIDLLLGSGTANELQEMKNIPYSNFKGQYKLLYKALKYMTKNKVWTYKVDEMIDVMNIIND